MLVPGEVLSYGFCSLAYVVPLKCTQYVSEVTGSFCVTHMVQGHICPPWGCRISARCASERVGMRTLSCLPRINALTFSSPYLDFISAFYLIKNKKRQKKTYIYVLKKKKMHTMLVTDSLIIASHHLLNNLYFPFPVQAPARRLPAELRGLHLLPSSPFSFPNSVWLQSENKPSHPLAY